MKDLNYLLFNKNNKRKVTLIVFIITIEFSFFLYFYIFYTTKNHRMIMGDDFHIKNEMMK